jgi:hypothetical protein
MAAPEREQRKKTLVCDFFDNISPYQRAVDLKTIMQKYDSYNGISAQQLSLAGQFVKQIKKHDSFFTFRETTKARYIANMSDIERQMKIISSDNLIIDGAYNDYENYLNNSGNSSYIVNNSTFFDLLRNTCELDVEDLDVQVTPMVLGKHNGNSQGIPHATPVNFNALGLRKTRKARRRKKRKTMNKMRRQ